MPYTISLTTIIGDPKDGPRNGDVVTIKGRSGTIVSQRELNTNVEFTLQDGDDEWTRRLRIGSQLNVIRTEQTDDEVTWATLQQFNTKVVTYLARSNNTVGKLVDQLIATVKTGLEMGYSRPFDLNEAANIAAKQELALIWRTIKARLEDSNVTGEWALVYHVSRMREECTIKLTRPYRNALSRSSSVTHNLREDLEMDAAANFLDEIKYLPLDELLAAMPEQN